MWAIEEENVTVNTYSQTITNLHGVYVLFSGLFPNRFFVIWKQSATNQQIHLKILNRFCFMAGQPTPPNLPPSEIKVE